VRYGSIVSTQQLISTGDLPNSKPTKKKLDLKCRKNSISNKKSGGVDFLVPDNARGEPGFVWRCEMEKSWFGSGFLCGCHSGSGGGRT